jgi:hypothetical protein
MTRDGSVLELSEKGNRWRDMAVLEQPAGEKGRRLEHPLWWRFLSQGPITGVVHVLSQIVEVLFKPIPYQLVEARKGFGCSLPVVSVLASAEGVQHALRVEKLISYFRNLKG